MTGGRERGSDVESLVSEFQETGDADAFRLIVQQFERRVFHLCLSILGPAYRADAEDVTQDVFLRVYRTIGSFRRESRFGTWLYRLAYREALDVRARARYRRPHDPIDELSAKSPHDPHATAAENERSVRLHAALDRLPDLYRAVITLHYWLGCSIDDIAETVGAPAGTVKSYLHRARAKLASELPEFGGRHD